MRRYFCLTLLALGPLPAADGGFTKGNTITIKVGDKGAAQWTQPADWAGTRDFPGRPIGAGTIALQAHDPGSTVYYKNIRIKLLQ